MLPQKDITADVLHVLRNFNRSVRKSDWAYDPVVSRTTSYSSWLVGDLHLWQIACVMDINEIVENSLNVW